MEKCSRLGIALSKRKAMLLHTPCSSAILSWVFIPEKLAFPYTRRLVPGCSVAQFAKAIISGIGTETVVYSFHGILNGRQCGWTNFGDTARHEHSSRTCQSHEQLRKDVCRTMQFTGSLTSAKAAVAMINPKLVRGGPWGQGRNEGEGL